MLVSVFSVSSFAASYDFTVDVSSYADLKDAISHISDNDTVLITLLDDITLKYELKINKSCTVYFRGNHNLILGQYRAFELTQDDIYLYFDKVGFYRPGNQGPGNGGAIYVNGSDCIIYGARFDGTFSTPTVSGDGGAIYVNDEGCLIENCKFLNCNAGGDGGAIYMNYPDCTVVNCEFANCKANSEGGAIFVDDPGCTISGCSFLECKGSGGAVYVCDESATVYDCEFTSCTQHAITVDGEDCEIEDCKFIDCHSTYNGGALYISDDGCYTKNCVFSNCSVTSTYLETRRTGGAAYVEDGYAGVYFDKCTFNDCSCAGKGQYVYGGDGTTIVKCTPSSNNTELFYKCFFSTSSSILGGLLGSTFSNGSFWITVVIGGAAVVAISLIMAKKNAKAAAADETAETEETAEKEEKEE